MQKYKCLCCLSQFYYKTSFYNVIWCCSWSLLSMDKQKIETKSMLIFSMLRERKLGRWVPHTLVWVPHTLVLKKMGTLWKITITEIEISTFKKQPKELKPSRSFIKPTKAKICMVGPNLQIKSRTFHFWIKNNCYWLKLNGNRDEKNFQ